LFKFALNLYRNKTNTTNKRESIKLYHEAGLVPEATAVPFPTVNMLSRLK
jgi:hypothetical protein